MTAKGNSFRCSAIVKASNNKTTEFATERTHPWNAKRIGRAAQTKVAMAQTNQSVTQPGRDHAYAGGSTNPMSVAQFRSRKRTIPPVKKSIVSLLCKLKPASVDPERPFSFDRFNTYSKSSVTTQGIVE